MTTFLAHLNLSPEELAEFGRHCATQSEAEIPGSLAKHLADTYGDRSPNLRTAYELNAECDVVFAIDGEPFGTVRVKADPFRVLPVVPKKRKKSA